MANIKTTPEEWIKCREYYEAGLSLSKVVAKTGISKTQISKRSNLEGWSKGTEKEQLIHDAVRVRVAKGTLTEQALSVHEELVDESARRMEWFNNATMIVAQKTMEKVTNENLSVADLKISMDTVGKGKENVFGKTPDTAIQINNQQQSITQDEFKQAAREVLDSI